MSNVRKPATKGLASLDAASVRAVHWFLLRLGALAVLALGLCLTSARSLRDALAVLSFACAIGGLVSMQFAKLRREPFGRGSLNGWDEALAFVAASRLAHLAQNLNA